MTAQTRITFLLPPFVHLLDIAGAAQVFQAGQTYGAHYALEWCSYERTVQSSANLGFTNLAWFEDIVPPNDGFLFVPGFDSSYALSGNFHTNTILHQWLQQAYISGATICSVCAGAFVLGAAGLLDRRRCTTHWQLIETLQQTFPTARVVPDVLFTQDSKIYTSAGISSGIDLALHILEERHGARLVHNVARELVVYQRRSGNHTQTSVYLDYRNHVHQGIHTVQDWIIEHLHTAPTLETLAEIALMSVRNLTRIFRQTTGISINEYTARVRREVAQTLMNNPNYTAQAIAEQCGLKSIRQLQRILAE